MPREILRWNIPLHRRRQYACCPSAHDQRRRKYRDPAWLCNLNFDSCHYIMNPEMHGIVWCNGSNYGFGRAQTHHQSLFETGIGHVLAPRLNAGWSSKHSERYCRMRSPSSNSKSRERGQEYIAIYHFAKYVLIGRATCQSAVGSPVRPGWRCNSSFDSCHYGTDRAVRDITWCADKDCGVAVARDNCQSLVELEWRWSATRSATDAPMHIRLSGRLAMED